MNVTGILKTGVNLAIKYAPQLLTAAGILGFGITAKMIADVTTKANEKIRAKETKEERTLGTMERIDLTWKDYAPSMCVFALSAGAVILGQWVVNKRLAETLLSCGATGAAANVCKDQLIDTKSKKSGSENSNDGEKQTKLTSDPGKNLTNARFRESITGQFVPIYYTDNDIKTAINNLNAELSQNRSVSLNDWLAYLGIEYCGLGYVAAWDSDKGPISFTYKVNEYFDGLVVDIIPDTMPEFSQY